MALKSIKLKTLPSWKGTVVVYELPPSASYFYVILATSMFPQLKPDEARTFIQHTNLTPTSAHPHRTDQLVLLKDIGKKGETIMGILTRCPRCIDLWNVIDKETLPKVETDIKGWEKQPTIESDSKADLNSPTKEGPVWSEMVRGGRHLLEWYETVENVKKRKRGEMLRIRGTAELNVEV